MGKKKFTVVVVLLRTTPTTPQVKKPKTKYVFQILQSGKYLMSFIVKKACNKKTMITIRYDTLKNRLTKQQPIRQTHFCSKRCALSHTVNDSKSQVHCLFLGPGGDGRERVMLLVTRQLQKRKNPPKRSDFNWYTWMRKGKINKVKSAGVHSGRYPWTQKANKFHEVELQELLFSNVRRWTLDLTFYVTQIIKCYPATMRLWPMHPYLPKSHLPDQQPADI